ncbi:LINC01091 isoform 4 [Pan troglodytes]|uniref:LINC01091 isoform 4 n=1 Tax=Pan troglodytes TaxID=9598 RepID=A0A2J8LXD3_PANTR|nr:LINC01091 isoform 4 [Pan troglodytes]
MEFEKVSHPGRFEAKSKHCITSSANISISTQKVQIDCKNKSAILRGPTDPLKEADYSCRTWEIPRILGWTESHEARSLLTARSLEKQVSGSFTS